MLWKTCYILWKNVIPLFCSVENKKKRDTFTFKKYQKIITKATLDPSVTSFRGDKKLSSLSINCQVLDLK